MELQGLQELLRRHDTACTAFDMAAQDILGVLRSSDRVDVLLEHSAPQRNVHSSLLDTTESLPDLTRALQRSASSCTPSNIPLAFVKMLEGRAALDQIDDVLRHLSPPPSSLRKERDSLGDAVAKCTAALWKMWDAMVSKRINSGEMGGSVIDWIERSWKVDGTTAMLLTRDFLEREDEMKLIARYKKGRFKCYRSEAALVDIGSMVKHARRRVARYPINAVAVQSEHSTCTTLVQAVICTVAGLQVRSAARKRSRINSLRAKCWKYTLTVVQAERELFQFLFPAAATQRVFEAIEIEHISLIMEMSESVLNASKPPGNGLFFILDLLQCLVLDEQIMCSFKVSKARSELRRLMEKLVQWCKKLVSGLSKSAEAEKWLLPAKHAELSVKDVIQHLPVLLSYLRQCCNFIEDLVRFSAVIRSFNVGLELLVSSLVATTNDYLSKRPELGCDTPSPNAALSALESCQLLTATCGRVNEIVSIETPANDGLLEKCLEHYSRFYADLDKHVVEGEPTVRLLKKFSKDLDALLSEVGSHYVADRALRRSLHDSIVGVVIPKYNELVQRIAEGAGVDRASISPGETEILKRIAKAHASHSKKTTSGSSDKPSGNASKKVKKKRSKRDRKSKR